MIINYRGTVAELLPPKCSFLMTRASLKAVTSISLMKSQCFSEELLYFCSYCSVPPNNEIKNI